MTRRKGEGSIFRRRDGRLVVELRSGGRKFGPLYARNDDDAIAKLEELRRRAGAGGPADPLNQTVGEYLRWWTSVELPARVLEETIAATTVASYGGVVERHLVPHIGHVRLRQLGVPHVKGLMRALAAEKTRRGQALSPRTRQYAHSVLRAALSTARDAELVERNVAELVAAPTVARTRPPVLSPTSAGKLLDAVAGDRLEAFWLVPMTLGLRPGEARALEWDAIDLDGAVAVVRSNLVRVGGQVRHHDTKGHRERTLALPAFAVDVLRAHRTRQRTERLQSPPEQWLGAEVWDRTGRRRVDVDLVFTDPRGRPLRSDWVEDELVRICRRAGVAPMTPHKFFRHGGATLMLAQGADVYTVKEILGHSSVTITEGYVQALAETKVAAAAGMDRMFGTRSQARFQP